LTIPDDLQRRYDEATYSVINRRLKMGQQIPKAPTAATSASSPCIDTPFFGYVLGFVYGLQYNDKSYSDCYANIVTSIIALDSLVGMLSIILIP